MLYQHALCTTVPQCICHTDPHTTADSDHLDQHASLSAANHDHRGCQQKAPLFARQSISVSQWCQMPVAPSGLSSVQQTHGSYLVQVIGGGQYWHASNHIHKHHPDAIRPDKHITTSCSSCYTHTLLATQAVQSWPVQHLLSLAILLRTISHHPQLIEET